MSNTRDKILQNPQILPNLQNLQKLRDLQNLPNAENVENVENVEKPAKPSQTTVNQLWQNESHSISDAMRFVLP